MLLSTSDVLQSQLCILQYCDLTHRNQCLHLLRPCSPVHSEYLVPVLLMRTSHLVLFGIRMRFEGHCVDQQDAKEARWYCMSMPGCLHLCMVSQTESRHSSLMLINIDVEV